MAERRTTPVELLWGLAFVFAITQVSAFLVHNLTWSGGYHAMILLALVWWGAQRRRSDSATRLTVNQIDSLPG